MEVSTKDYPVCDQCRIKKIRCGREKPICANCNRAKQDCEWSGQGKKGNQTSFLSHTVVGLGSRLQHLEASVLDTQRSLKRLLEEAGPDTARLKRRYSQASLILDTPSSHSQSPTLRLLQPNFPRPVGRLIKMNNDELEERYFGPVSLECVILNVRDYIGHTFGPEKLRQPELTLQAQSKIDFVVQEMLETAVDYGSPPTSPPTLILEAMIEPYFEIVHPYFPIWNRQQLQSMATALRNGTLKQDSYAITTCCNSLILMVLAAHSITCRRERHTHPTDVHQTSDTDGSVASGFLTNAKRAIQGLQVLLRPRLINLQALLSLCIVAQIHLSSVITENVFLAAVQVAKALGLPEARVLRDRASDKDYKTRESLSCCLCIARAAVYWISDISPTLSIRSLCFDVKELSLDDCAMSRLSAKVGLSVIVETLHADVYAHPTTDMSEQRASQTLANIRQQLEDWASRWNIIGLGEEVTESTRWRFELQFEFLCTKLLLLWSTQERSDGQTQQRVSLARKCIGLLLRLWDTAASPKSFFVISQLVAAQPPLYLHEICIQILSSQAEDTDVESLQRFIDMLRYGIDPREPDTHNEKLRKLLTILIDLITATRQTQSQPYAERTFSRSTSLGQGQMHSGLQRPETGAVESSSWDEVMMLSPSSKSHGLLRPTGSTRRRRTDSRTSTSQLSELGLGEHMLGESLYNTSTRPSSTSQYLPTDAAVIEVDNWWDGISSLGSEELFSSYNQDLELRDQGLNTLSMGEGGKT